jgi:hypothetical protein
MELDFWELEQVESTDAYLLGLVSQQGVPSRFQKKKKRQQQTVQLLGRYVHPDGHVTDTSRKERFTLAIRRSIALHIRLSACLMG